MRAHKKLWIVLGLLMVALIIGIGLLGARSRNQAREAIRECWRTFGAGVAVTEANARCIALEAKYRRENGDGSGIDPNRP